MCSKKSTIKCFFPLKDSIYSEPYLKLSCDEETIYAPSQSLDEIRIIFNNRIKLLKGIHSKTTFGDLKLAMLVSRHVSENRLKPKENYGEKKWCICESVNKVEKILTSDLLVQEEMKRVNQEIEITNNEFQVIYIMRLKSNLQVLKNNYQNELSNKISILAEFCPRSSSYKKRPRKNGSIQDALKRLDTFIDERKKLIKLLEDYYETLDSFDENKSNANQDDIDSTSNLSEEDRSYVISKLNVKDSDSCNSSFNSSDSSKKYETYV